MFGGLNPPNPPVATGLFMGLDNLNYPDDFSAAAKKTHSHAHATPYHQIMTTPLDHAPSSTEPLCDTHFRIETKMTCASQHRNKEPINAQQRAEDKRALYTRQRTDICFGDASFPGP